MRVHFATNRIRTPQGEQSFGTTPSIGSPPPLWVGHGEVFEANPDFGDERYEIDGPLHIEGPIVVSPGESILNPALLDDLNRPSPAGTVRHAIVFIHGFANPFDTCFHRIAELRDNYLPKSAPGEPEPLLYVFSWPSDGFVMPAQERYRADRSDAFESGAAMAAALRTLIDQLTLPGGHPSGLRVHLVAHSMGNWALHAALLHLGAFFPDTLPVLFENVFLMAADEDFHALEPGQGLRPVCDLAKRVHVYYSANDFTLRFSETKMGNLQRLGLKGPKDFSKVASNVTLIDCADVSDTPSVVHGWHQYYRQRQEVYEDVAAVIAGQPLDGIAHRTVVAPGRRFKLKRRFFVGLPDHGANLG